MNKPAIFDAFPELEDRIPWTCLGDFPTPVHLLDNLGFKNLWIKRDDKSSAEYGGNKVRKLEFVIADAIKKGSDRIATVGGIGTNHGLATSVFAKRLGLKCSLLLLDQPVNDYVKRNILMFQKYGAEMIYAKNIPEAYIHHLIIKYIRPGKVYTLGAGGSSPLGTIGFVSAAFELKKQIEEGLIPEPDIIICPLGSNGTMAGLTLGVQLAGLNIKVIGIRVTSSHIGPFESCTKKMVTSLMNKSLELMGKDFTIDPERYEVISSYFGKGYGYPTTEGLNAISIMRESENIKLEPTYTGKTFAAVLDIASSKEYSGKNILYWHTYNSVDLSAAVSTVDINMLPRRFKKYVTA